MSRSVLRVLLHRLSCVLGCLLVVGCVPQLEDLQPTGTDAQASSSDHSTGSAETPAARDAALFPDATDGPSDTSSERSDASIPALNADSSTEQVTLVVSEPSAGEQGVSIDSGLMLVFDRDVVFGRGHLRLVDDASGDVVDDIAADSERVQADGPVLTVTWSQSLRHATTYAVELDSDAIVGLDGVSYPGLGEHELTFVTAEPPALLLLGTLPQNGATQVEPGTELELAFSEEVVAGAEGALAVVESASGSEVESVILSDANRVGVLGSTVTVSLSQALSLGTTYYVTLEPGAVVSTLGAPFEGFNDQETFTFTTREATPLVLASSLPMDDAQAVDPNTSLVLTFSLPIVAAQGNVSVFRVGETEPTIRVAVQDPHVTIVGDSLTIDFDASFEPGTDYFVLVDPGIVKSEQGAPFAGILGETDLTFTTAVQALVALNLVDQQPARGETGVAVDTDIILTFDAPISRGAGSVSVYRVDDDEQLASVSVGGAGAEFAGSTLTIHLSAPLPGSTPVYVLVGAGAVAGQERGAFPGISMPDVYTFATESVFELDSLSPLNGATNVSVATDLVLAFTDLVKAGAGSIQVQNSNGNLVETIPVSDPRITAQGNTVTIDLDSILAGNTDYSVVVPAGAFVEAAGTGSMGAINASGWTFHTAAVTLPGGVATGLVLWLDADYPASVKTASGVRLWADRSGQQHNVEQAVTAKRPSVVAQKMNGRDVLKFDGTDDVLSAASLFDYSNLEGFIVWRSGQAPSTTQDRSLLSNGYNFEINHGHTGGRERAMPACTGNCGLPAANWYSAVFAPIPVVDQAYIWSFGYNATSTSMFARVNSGTADTQTALTTRPASPNVPLKVGGDSVDCTQGCFYDGEVAEVLLYSRDLAANEALLVTEYLQQKWLVPSGQCKTDEKQGPNGHCYTYSNQTQGVTWDAARQACQARGIGWDLATVRGELDHQFITTQLLVDSQQAWIGAQDGNPNDTWRWVTDNSIFWTGRATGSAVNGAFTAWIVNEPSDQSANEQCARYRFDQGNWYWADIPCSDLYNYVCEGPAQ